ncbi:hypothetical protein ACKWTF_013241 [Chironomus riparius]
MCSNKHQEPGTDIDSFAFTVFTIGSGFHAYSISVPGFWCLLLHMRLRFDQSQTSVSLILSIEFEEIFIDFVWRNRLNSKQNFIDFDLCIPLLIVVFAKFVKPQKCHK